MADMQLSFYSKYGCLYIDLMGNRAQMGLDTFTLAVTINP
jgi:hypothetical protein